MMEPSTYWVGKRIRRRRFLGGMVAGAAGLGLAGCAGASTSPTPAVTAAPAVSAPTTAAQPVASPTPAARQPKYGSIHRQSNGSGDTPHLDIHQSNSSALAAHGAGMALSQLLWYKNGPAVPMPTFEIEGDLAERWEQPDDTTYIFRLRPGVKYQNLPPVNGREVEAEDVVQSFRRQLDLRVNAGYLAGLRTIDAVDRSTVRITTDAPNADFLWSLAQVFCKVLPRELIALGDLKEGPIVGSGPYIFREWESGRSLTLARNPDYYLRGRPYLDGMQWFRIGDSATLLSAFRSKNLDGLRVGVTRTDGETLKRESPEVVVRTVPGLTRYELSLKGDRPPFNDVRVRQAVFKAINRQEIIDTVFGGAGRLSTGLTLNLPAAELPEDEIRRLYAYDLPGARRLLQEAGVTSVEAEMQVGNFLAGLVVQVAELVQAQLRMANINMTLRVVEGAVYTGPIRVQGQYIAALGLQATQAPTSSELFNRHHSKGPQFSHGIADPELDAMIDRQSTMVRDTQGRARLLQEIQRKMIGLYGYNMIAMQNDTIISWPYVQDWNTNASSNNPPADYIWTWHDK